MTYQTGHPALSTADLSGRTGGGIPKSADPIPNAQTSERIFRSIDDFLASHPVTSLIGGGHEYASRILAELNAKRDVLYELSRPRNGETPPIDPNQARVYFNRIMQLMDEYHTHIISESRSNPGHDWGQATWE